MRLRLLHTSLMVSLCALFTACSDTDLSSGASTSDDGKTPIELRGSTAGDVMPLSRADIIDGNGKITAFEKNTRLTLLMISKDAATSPTADKYALTYALALGSGKAPGDSDAPEASNISFATTKTVDKQVYTDPTNINPEADTSIPSAEGDGSVRYWDDAHGRTSQLSIYGFAVNNTILPLGAPWNQKINGEANNANLGWKTLPNDYKYTIGGESGSNTVKWKVGDQRNGADYKSQSFKSLLYKDDISYSNNISYPDGGTDARMKFGIKTTGKFDDGKLTFHRAMSMLSFKVTIGGGFDNTKADNFRFENGNIALKGFNKEGYLDIKEGEWKEVSMGADATYNNKTGYSWNKIANVTEGKTIDQISDHTYHLLALVIPGTDIKNSTETEAVSMIIDGNEYKISMKQLYDAIIANSSSWKTDWTEKDVFDKLDSETEYVRLKPGINYEFTFVVGKTAIDKIQAQIVDWETVTGAASPDNAHDLTVSMETQAGGSQTPPASRLFKSATTAANLTGVEKGYSNTSGDYFDLSSGTSVQNTGWYWPNNQTYYHLRTISPRNALTVDGSTSDNYITIIGGAVNNTTNDYVWGAPLIEKHASGATSHPIVYNESKGYEDYLYPAIGPTKNNIHITQFHMMSDLEIKLLTTSGADAVTLTGATVELINYANQAKLMVGKGIVNGWSDIKTTAQAMTTITDGSDYTWRTVPQSLSRGNAATDKVGLKVTLTDGNVYEIKDLSTLPVTIGSTSTTIPRWEPGKKYVYNLTLKKSAIDNITATIVDWETVEANYDDVKID